MSDTLMHSPWSYDHNDGIICSVADERIIIATLVPQKDEDGHEMRDFHGDAMAAAPELLAALVRIVGRLPYGADYDPNRRTAVFLTDEAMRAAQAAIAKAGGRP